MKGRARRSSEAGLRDATAVGEDSEGAVADGCPGSPQFIQTFPPCKTGFLKQQSFIFGCSGGEGRHNLGCEKEDSRAARGIHSRDLSCQSTREVKHTLN